eukprot:SAG22_NODE_22269_length_232_cov_34.503759_1_plen_48_part_01
MPHLGAVPFLFAGAADVWATRADWVTLAGEVGPANPVAVTIFDHPANP